jgi:WD40 repeat protein
MALSAGGRFAVLHVQDALEIWGLTQKKLIRRVVWRENLQAVSIDSSGRFVALATPDGNVTVLELALFGRSGFQETISLAMNYPSSKKIKSAAITFSADGQYLAIAKRWLLSSIIEIFQMDKHPNSRQSALEFREDVTALAFSANNLFLAVGGFTGEIEVFNVPKILLQYNAASLKQASVAAVGTVSLKAPIRQMQFSTDGAIFAASTNEKLGLWQANKKFLPIKNVRSTAVAAWAFGKGQRFVEAFHETDYRDEFGIITRNTDQFWASGKTFYGTSNPVRLLEYQNPNALVGVSTSGIHFFDLQKRLETDTIRPTAAKIGWLVFDKSRDALWSMQFNTKDLGRFDLAKKQYQTLYIRDSHGQILEPQNAFPGRNGDLFLPMVAGNIMRLTNNRFVEAVNSDRYKWIDVATDGRFAVDEDKFGIYVLNLRTKVEKHLLPKRGIPWVITFYDRNQAITLNTESDFAQFSFWDMASGKEIRRLPAQKFRSVSSPSHLQVSPDKQFLVSANKQGTLNLWDAKTGRHLFDWYELKDDSYGGCCYQVISELKITPDSRFIVAVSERGAVIWDVRSRKAVLRLNSLSGKEYSAVALHPTEKRFWIANQNGFVTEFRYQ